MAETSNLSNTVDLSRLPAPTVVEHLSYEQIYAAQLGSLIALLPTFDATMESDPAVKVLQVAAYRELLLRQQFNERLKQVMLAYATNSNLDQLGANFGVFRLTIDPGDPTAGIDPVYESDDDLRERIVLSPESYTSAGPEESYIFHARSADGTIRDASATSPSPGVVLVTILSRIGDGSASAEQIDAVADVLAPVAGNKVRPLTDSVVIASAEIVNYTIAASLTLLSGPDEALVLSAAQDRLNTWLANSGKLGADAVRAAISAALFVEGVQNVALISPAADVVVDRTQSAHCAGVSVAVAGRGI